MRVLGIDLAAKHTGLVAVDIRNWPCNPVEPLYEGHVECENTTPGRINAALEIMIIVNMTQPDLVVIEDYTFQSRSFVSFSVGELSGMLRYMLWAYGHDQLWVPPMKLKAFLNRGGKTPMAKKEIAKAVEELFGWKSQLKYAKEREDATDAFVLAVMGVALVMLLSPKYKDTVDEWLTEKQSKVFYNTVRPSSNPVIIRGLLDVQFSLQGWGRDRLRP